MIPDYGEKIYEILSSMFGLKFKAQIKDSGIEFEGIFKITDLESNLEYYTLVLNGEQIVFGTKTEFISTFISFLEKNIREYDRRFEELQKTANDRWIDENQIYLEHEEIGHFGYKQSKLLKRVREIEKTLGNRG